MLKKFKNLLGSKKASKKAGALPSPHPTHEQEKSIPHGRTLLNELSSFAWIKEENREMICANILSEEVIDAIRYAAKLEFLGPNFFDFLVQNETISQLLAKIYRANIVLDDTTKFYFSWPTINFIESKSIALINSYLDKKLIRMEDLLPLAQLSNNKQAILKNHLQNLENHGLLNQDSFQKVLVMISSKLEKPEPESQAIAAHDKVANPPSQGSFGEVTVGSIKLNNSNTLVAIKRHFSEIDNKMKINSEKNARHEVKYSRFLNNKFPANYFKNNDADKDEGKDNDEWCHTTKFHHGQLIWKVTEGNQIKSTVNPTLHYINRLNGLRNALEKLNKLHEYGRVHGDIKPNNFIIREDGKLYLIDFGSTRKQGSDRFYPPTPEFLQTHKTHSAYHFSDDVYSMGIVVASLFPEIYSFALVNKKFIPSISKKSLTVFEKAITLLVNAMMHADPGTRCHIQDALNFRQQLSQKFDNLTEEDVAHIAKLTIHRDELNAEDVIRGKYKR